MKYTQALLCLCLTTLPLSSCGGGGGSSQGSTASSGALEMSELPDAVTSETRLRAASADLGGRLQIQELRFINPQLVMMRNADGWQEREEELFVADYSRIDTTSATLRLQRTVQKDTDDPEAIGAVETLYNLDLTLESGALHVSGTELTGDFELFRNPALVETSKQIDSVIEWVTPE